MVLIVRVLACLVMLAMAGEASAQQKTTAAVGTLPGTEALNAGTVTVITAPVGGPMSVMGSDMANVLDDGDRLRVLPILGKGSVQNLVDILRLRNVDMGFVATDAIEFVRTEYGIPDIARRVRYIAQLFHNDVHVVARREIRSLRDLAGRRVFAERNLGYASARIIFQRLGIEAEFDVTTDADGGLARLLNGDGDAWIVSTGKVAPVIKNIRNEGGRVHLLSIPYDRALQDIYLPSSFSAEDYPNLVPQGARVETVAAATVLMVYNWPAQSERYRRVAQFVTAMFDRIDQLQRPPRHPKWRDTVLSARVAGLTRFRPAQDWLDAQGAAAAAATVGSAGPRPIVNEAGSGGEDGARLRNDFLRWQRAKEQPRP